MSTAVRKRLAQLRALSVQEWQTLLFSLLLLPLVALALHTRGYKRTLAVLQKRIPETGTTSTLSQNKLAMAKSTARMVNAAAKYGPYRANCLKRSLVTWWLLQRKGIETKLVIGMESETENLNAHAWVEYMGDSLHESEDVKRRFSAFK